jgi:hypothetical protein
MTTFLAFLQAIIQIPALLQQLVEQVNFVGNRIDASRIEEMQKELAVYKLQVSQTLKDIENAKTSEERRALSAQLAGRLR